MLSGGRREFVTFARGSGPDSLTPESGRRNARNCDHNDCHLKETHVYIHVHVYTLADV